MPGGGEVVCQWPGSQIPSLRGLDEFRCRASELKKKKKSKMLIFLVPTHSLTMNTNVIEISTSLQSRLTFKANAKGLKTQSRRNNIHKNREGLKAQKPSCFSRVGLRSHGPPACDLGTPGLSSLPGNWSGCKTHVALQEMTSRDVLWGIQAYSCHLSALGTGGGRDREGQEDGGKGGEKLRG